MSEFVGASIKSLSHYQSLCRLCLSRCENFTRFLPDPAIKKEIQQAIHSLYVSFFTQFCLILSGEFDFDIQYG